MRAASVAARPALLASIILAVVAMAGCGSAPAIPAGGGTATAAASQFPSSTGTASPATTGPAPIAPATLPGGTSPVSRYPTGGPVPAGFAADSVTFVSAQQAFVLGTAPCAHGPCTSILRTLNGGATWRGLPAPVAPIGRPGLGASPQVWGIRFATPTHGFVFGNGLWVTTDGGAHWARTACPGGQILSLATIDGQVLALIAPSSSTGTGAGTETLYRRMLGGGAWQPVTKVHGSWSMDPTDMIATQAGIAAVLDTSSVVVTTNGGLTYARRALPRLPSGIFGPAVVTPTGSGGLALLCTGDAGMGQVTKVVYTSADLGAHWAKAGMPFRFGFPAAIAAGTPGTLVIAASSAASWLFSSRNGGAGWTVARTEPDGGMGWADLGFTTSSRGVVIHGPARSASNAEKMPGQLMLTSNGGATWHLVSY